RSLFGRSLELDASLVADLRARVGVRATGGGVGPEQQALRIVGIAVLVGPFNDPILIVAAENRAPADRAIRTFALAAACPLAAFASGLLAVLFIQARWGLAPVFKLRDAVIEIREGERERLDENVPSELVPLARELNALIDYNRDLVERARAHVGNLA